MVPVVIIATAALIANFWHVLRQWYANPSGSFFVGITHYYGDYFLYASQITQGIRGNWLFARQLFTDEPFAATWIYWPNVLIGRMGSIVTRNPFLLYLTSLVLFTVVLCWLLWHIADDVFPKNRAARVTAFLFALSASNFPDLASWFAGNPLTLVGNTWFSPTPALNRLGGVPHQTLQTILLLTVIHMYTRSIDPKTDRIPVILRFVAFGFLCFVSATVAPTQMVLVSAAIGAHVLYRYSRASAVRAAIGVAAAALGAFLVNRAFDGSPIFVAAKAWETGQTVSVSVPGFLVAIGPIILLIPFGIRSFVRRISPIRFLLVVYGVLSVIVFFSPIPALLSTSSVRWLHPASYLFLPLLAAEGTVALSRAAKRYASTVFFLLISLYMVLTVPAILAQIKARESADYLSGPLNHIPAPVVKTLRELSDLPDGVVLTSPDLPYDVMIPAFTGRTSFTGHLIHTSDSARKEALRRAYFEGSMTEDEKRRFLAAHRIRYILTEGSAGLRLEIVSP